MIEEIAKWMVIVGAILMFAGFLIAMAEVA